MATALPTGTIDWTARGPLVIDVTQGSYWESDIYVVCGFKWFLKFRTNYKKKGWCVLSLFLVELPPHIKQLTVKSHQVLKETKSTHSTTQTYSTESMNWAWPDGILASTMAANMSSFTFAIRIQLLSVYDINDKEITTEYLNSSHQISQSAASNTSGANIQAAGSDSLAIQMEAMLNELKEIKTRLSAVEQQIGHNDEDSKENKLDHLQHQIDAINKKLSNNTNADNAMDKEKIQFKNWVFNTLKLPEYYDVFVENGADTLTVMKMFTMNELQQIGIAKIGHRMQILHAINELKPEGGQNNNQMQEGNTALLH